MNANEHQCPDCGHVNCNCDCTMETVRDESLPFVLEEVKTPTVEMALDESAKSVFNILIKPKGWRIRLLKWWFPEIRDLAGKLRKYYWSDDT